MKTLKLLLGGSNGTKKDNSLFTKLKQIKTSNSSVKREQEEVERDQTAGKGIDFEEQQQLIQLSLQISKFKIEKAQEIAAVYRRTKSPLQSIMRQFHDHIINELQDVLTGKKKMICYQAIKSPKQLGSTVANSEDKEGSNDTPSFDMARNVKEIHEFSIDLREFTLGQKDTISSGKSPDNQKQENGGYVSEFSVCPKEPTSKRIKDRIMNSGKNKVK